MNTERSRTVRACVKFSLRLGIAFLIELTELAKLARMPRLRCKFVLQCNTQSVLWEAGTVGGPTSL